MKNKISFSLSVCNLLLVISTINSFEFSLLIIPTNNFFDKLIYCMIFALIPISLSIISIKLIKNSIENAKIYFIKFISYITIIFFLLMFVIMIFH